MNTFRIHSNKALTAILTLTAVCTSFSLYAEETTEPVEGYKLTFVSSEAHGDLMEQGRYRLVAHHLLDSNSPNPLAANINLCVANIMIGEHRQARRNCNKAVELGEQAAISTGEDVDETVNANWGVALSNRGVLRAIRGQNGAAEDFRKAVVLQVESDTAAHNLAHFNEGDQEALVATNK